MGDWKRSILIMSAGLPLKDSNNGGAATLYGLINDIRMDYKLYLISYFLDSEKSKINDLPKDVNVIRLFKSRSSKLYSIFISPFKLVFSTINPLFFYMDFSDHKFKKDVLKFLSTNKINVINVQWTSMGRFIPFIKRKYPDIKVVTYMHDIDSQRFDRRTLPKFFKSIFSKVIIRAEIRIVNLSSIVLCPSEKDSIILRKLLSEREQKKVQTMKLNFQTFFSLDFPKRVENIGFFGLMSRPDNYLALDWFIDNVFLKLDENKFNLLIAGYGMPKYLVQKLSGFHNVKYLGFVKDLSKYISNCDLFIAPIQQGAGVKLKVVQALSGGRPVIGTNIAYEGIDDTNILPRSNSPIDFLRGINHLASDFNHFHKLCEESRNVADSFLNQGVNILNVLNHVTE